MTLVGVGLWWVGCAGTEAPPAPTPAVTVGGSETLTEHLVPDLAARFRELHPEVQITVTGGGSQRGIRGLLDKELDIGASSREVTPSEEEQARANGWSFAAPESRHVIAVDVIAVAVHPNNPVQALSYDDVIHVFCDGSVTSWSQLGGPELPIAAMTRDPASGTRALFEDFFCGARGIHASVQVGTTAEAAKLLTENPGAIAYVSLSENVGRSLALRPEADAAPLAPTLDAISTGAYPLYRDVALYTAGAPGEGPASNFLAFIRGDAGQQIIAQHRFVPLQSRPARLDGPRPLRQTVHFDAGATVPNARSTEQLALLVQEIRERKWQHVVLEGFSDPTEADGTKLSEERAQAVQKLIAAELPELFFEVIPRGADNPLAPNDTPYGRLRNRRVQVYLADEEAPEPSTP